MTIIKPENTPDTAAQQSDQPAPDGPAPGTRKLIFAMVAVLLLAVVALIIIQPGGTANDGARADAASRFGKDFAMTDQNGQTVTDQTLRGKPYAIFFGFTRCPDVCPTTLSRMAQLRKKLGADGAKMNIVFASVDPKYDSQQSIKDYLTLFDTPIIGLTGTDDQTAKMVKAFGVYYQKVPVEGGDYTIDHTASIFLMDRQGQFVTTIDHQEAPDSALGKMRDLINRG